MLVVFPYSPGDQTLAVKQAEWIQELGKNAGHTCLIVRDARCTKENNSAIETALRQSFDSVEILNIPEIIDGWPMGPNNFLRRAAKQIEYTSKQAFLWCEPDCVPMRSGWVDEIAAAYAEALKAGKVFMGDLVTNSGDQNSPPDKIMSGIGVYPGNMSVNAGTALLTDDIPFDVAGAEQIVPRMHDTKLIHTIWKHPPFTVDTLKDIPRECALFHADKSFSIVPLLRDKRVEWLKTSAGLSNGTPQWKINPEYERASHELDVETGTLRARTMEEIGLSPKLWESKLETVTHIRSLSDQLKAFCTDSGKTRIVRGELRRSGVIK